MTDKKGTLTKEESLAKQRAFIARITNDVLVEITNRHKYELAIKEKHHTDRYRKMKIGLILSWVFIVILITIEIIAYNL